MAYKKSELRIRNVQQQQQSIYCLLSSKQRHKRAGRRESKISKHIKGTKLKEMSAKHCKYELVTRTENPKDKVNRQQTTANNQQHSHKNKTKQQRQHLKVKRRNQDRFSRQMVTKNSNRHWSETKMELRKRWQLIKFIYYVTEYALYGLPLA